MSLNQGIFSYLSDKIWEPVYKLFSLVTTRYFDICGPEFLKRQEAKQECGENALAYILNELQSKFQAFFLQQDIDFQKNVEYLIQQILPQFSSPGELDVLLNSLVGLHAKEYFKIYQVKWMRLY